MDAVEIILYVAIMIIWVIIQNSRKKKLKQQREAQQNTSQENYDQFDEDVEDAKPGDRSLIDEIIRELKNEPEDIEIEQKQEYRPELKKDFTQSETSFSNDYQQKLSILESQKKKKETGRFDRYKMEKKYEIEDEETDNDYASLIFEDPDSPRKAVILSEILNRRHF